MANQIDLDAYRANSYVLVPDVFDAETLGELQRETDALLERDSRSGRSTEATWKGAWRESAGVGVADAAPATRVDGSHTRGPIEHRSDNSFYLDMAEWPLERAQPIEAQAGDVLLFSYFTVHGSYVNTSTRPRRILLIQMRDPDDRPTTEQHRSPGQGTMLRGINPNALEL